MKLRTFEGEPVRGELTTDSPVSQEGLPVLLVNDEPFSPEEAEFFIEYATHDELDMLREGGYDLPGVYGCCGPKSGPLLSSGQGGETVAGRMARTDAERGIWKTPARLIASLKGVQGRMPKKVC